MKVLEDLRNTIWPSKKVTEEKEELLKRISTLEIQLVENNNLKKTKEKVKELGTYKRILELLPEEVLSALPKEVFTLLGYGFLGEFKKALIEMRKNGIGYVVCAKLTNSDITPFYVSDKASNKNFEVKVNPETKEFEYYLDKVQIDKKYVLVFGDERRHENSKLQLTTSQQSTVYQYEEALSMFFNKINNSYAWFVKIAGYNDMFLKTGNASNQIQSKIKDIAKRKADSLIYLEKDDEINVVQMNLSWFSEFIKEYKIKICLDFNVPYTKLFGESASGLTATGEGDRRSWYDSVKSFQALYIFPNLIKLATLWGKKEEFKLIKLENIEQQDKQLEAHIQALELNNVIQAVSNGLIKEKEACTLTKSILGINNKGENNDRN